MQSNIDDTESIMIDPNTKKIFKMATAYIHFSQTESCGWCVPCRIGSKRLGEILKRIAEGEGSLSDMAILKRIGGYMKISSRCPHGRSTGNTLLSIIDTFFSELQYQADPNLILKGGEK